MLFDKEKFKDLIHFICNSRADDPSTLGSVKLNKSLWLSDFIHYYETGEPITGARYIKRQFGPVPASILSAKAELVAEGRIEVEETSYFGHAKNTFRVKKPAQTDRFDDAELATIIAATEFVCFNHTAKSISDLSHDHVWKVAKDGETIPYFTVFAVPGEITANEREWARIEIAGLMV